MILQFGKVFRINNVERPFHTPDSITTFGLYLFTPLEI